MRHMAHNAAHLEGHWNGPLTLTNLVGWLGDSASCRIYMAQSRDFPEHRGSGGVHVARCQCNCTVALGFELYAHEPVLYTYVHMAAASHRLGYSQCDVYLPVAIVRIVAHSCAARVGPMGLGPPSRGAKCWRW